MVRKTLFFNLLKWNSSKLLSFWLWACYCSIRSKVYYFDLLLMSPTWWLVTNVGDRIWKFRHFWDLGDRTWKCLCQIYSSLTSTVKFPVIKDHLVLSDFLPREKSLSSHMSVKLSVLNYLWTVETKRLKSETETNYMQQVHKLFIPSDPQEPSYKPVYFIPYIT